MTDNTFPEQTHHPWWDSPIAQRELGTLTPHRVMPLGGIGTGNLAIGPDGGLRQWQLHNIANHTAALPGSFFALRVTRIEPPLEVVRLLQTTPPPSTNTPLVTDDVVPGWVHDILRTEQPMASAHMATCYPLAHLTFSDPEIPATISLQATNPLVPLDCDTSAIPAALFTITITNDDDFPLHGSLGAAVQNAIGWDGVSPLHHTSGAGYGGNVNRVRRTDGWTRLVMDNPSLAADAPANGQLVLAVDDPRSAVLPQWQRPDEFFAFLRSRALASGDFRLARAPHRPIPDPQAHGPQPAFGPSPPGHTWNGGIAVPFWVEPGQRHRIRIAVCWSMPNRYVNFEQFGPPRPEWGRSRFWLGNHYSIRYPDAVGVAQDVANRWAELHKATEEFVQVFATSTLKPVAAQHLLAQAATIRSPSLFRDDQGHGYAFEGSLGASTTMWSGDVGGSCPMNCTHVLNYAQATARLFPNLEVDQRETEFDVMQAPDGSIPHRLIVPRYLPQLWSEAIGGPDQPALDGMLGAILKTYREFLTTGDVGWLQRYWPKLKLLLEHIQSRWDPGTGVLRGIQPSTHDIDLCGANTYMGTLYLAALRTVEEVAAVLGDDGSPYSDRFALASNGYQELFNGEYFEQRLDPGDQREFQWLTGCLSDQLIGAWWARILGLGDILPPAQVRTALAHIVKYNLRTDFTNFAHPYRIFADGADSGLVMCSWPHGGRPAVPTRYADEVWTGSEYQIAAHLLFEGMDELADAVLAAVWTRYDGTRRNPFNEIECGDHYQRSLAGWSVLDAVHGLHYNAHTQTLTVRPPRQLPARIPFVVGGGWGQIRYDGCPDDADRSIGDSADPQPGETEITADGVRIRVVLAGGSLPIRQLRADFTPRGSHW